MLADVAQWPPGERRASGDNFHFSRAATAACGGARRHQHHGEPATREHRPHTSKPRNSRRRTRGEAGNTRGAGGVEAGLLLRRRRLYVACVRVSMCVCPCTCPCVRVSVSVGVGTHVRVGLCTWLYVSPCVRVFVCTCMSVSTCVSVYVCMFSLGMGYYGGRGGEGGRAP